jgi:hypothetical protein
MFAFKSFTISWAQPATVNRYEQILCLFRNITFITIITIITIIRVLQLLQLLEIPCGSRLVLAVLDFYLTSRRFVGGMNYIVLFGLYKVSCYGNNCFIFT